MPRQQTKGKRSSEYPIFRGRSGLGVGTRPVHENGLTEL
jgi:hypothetical protein